MKGIPFDTIFREKRDEILNTTETRRIHSILSF